MNKGQGAVHPGQKKRGRKSYVESRTNIGIALMPLREIAEKTGMCERTVYTHLTTGLQKLSGLSLKIGDKVSVAIQQCVLERVWGVADNDYHPPIQAHSAECGGEGILPFKLRRRGGFEEDD